eukprot:1542631-Pleurochrysis_carterae.AAC.1
MLRARVCAARMSTPELVEPLSRSRVIIFALSSICRKQNRCSFCRECARAHRVELVDCALDAVVEGAGLLVVLLLTKPKWREE